MSGENEEFYRGVVTCGLCGKLLAEAERVPESDCHRAAVAAQENTFCLGHTQNFNVNVSWQRVPASQPAPPPEAAETPEQEAERPPRLQASRKNLRETTDALLADLTPREAAVLRKRFDGSVDRELERARAAREKLREKIAKEAGAHANLPKVMAMGERCFKVDADGDRCVLHGDHDPIPHDDGTGQWNDPAAPRIHATIRRCTVRSGDPARQCTLPVRHAGSCDFGPALAASSPPDPAPVEKKTEAFTNGQASELHS